MDAILNSLATHPPVDVRDSLVAVIRNRDYPDDNRQRACSTWIASLADADAGRLQELAISVEDGPLLRQLIAELGKHPNVDSRSFLIGKLDSANVDVRAAAVGTLSHLKVVESGEKIAC